MNLLNLIKKTSPFDFLLPIFLLALLFIMIPFLIHFYQKLTKKKLRFSPIFLFVKEIHQANRTVNVKNVFIIGLRVLMIAVIAILLAKPFMDKESKKWQQEIHNEKVTLILVDNSRSMNYFLHNQNLFQKVIKQLTYFAQEWPEKTSVILDTLASDSTVPVKIMTSKNKLIKQLDFIRLHPPDMPFSIKVTNLLKQIKKQKINLKRIIIFSDFQITDWQQVQLQIKVPLVLVKIGSDKANNLGILKVTTDSDLYLSNNEADLQIYLKNFSQKTQKNYIQIYQDNQSHSKDVEIVLEPKEEKKQSIKISSFQDKWLFATVKLKYDRYADDNEQSFSFYFKKKPHVLLLAHPDYPFISYSIKNSLTSQSKSKLSLIRFTYKPGYEDDYDLIITNRLDQLENSELEAIKSGLKKGIPVFIFLNQQDNVYKIRTNLEKLALSDDLNIVKKKKLKKNAFMQIHTALTKDDGSNSFHTVFSKLPLSVYFNSNYVINYKKTRYIPLLKIDSNSLLIQSTGLKKKLFFMSAGLNTRNSNFLYDQWAPLLFNWIFHEGIRKKMRAKVKIKDIPKQKTTYIKESDLTSYSKKDLQKLFAASTGNVHSDIKDYLLTQTPTNVKSAVQRNSLLERILFYCLVFFILIEFILAYPISTSKHLQHNNRSSLFFNFFFKFVDFVKGEVS